MNDSRSNASGSLRRRISLRKRIVFSGIVLAAMWLAVELISLAVLYVGHGGWGTVAELRGRFARGVAEAAAFCDPEDVLHPYLGWVRRPERAAEDSPAGSRVNGFGFVDREVPVRKRKPGQVIVGILGGSLAEEFSQAGLTALEGHLKAAPGFEGKEVTFVRLATSGYKQPQQLMAVAYLLTLGAEFDILVNIDGFNEAVLPAVENVPGGVFAAFPRGWRSRVTETSDLVALRTVGRVSYLKDRAKSWATFFGTTPLCWSPTCTLVWTSVQARIHNSLLEELSQLSALKSADANYAATGPPEDFPGDDSLYRHCTNVWGRSSMQLHRLCEANGIRYFHFLQPNQYVPDSKPMSDEEKAVALNEDHVGRKPVEAAYPLFIAEGRRLAAAGVRFSDLTGLFRQEHQATYRDDCCHLNQRGNELLAARIAEVIGQAVAE